jgi:hypothetical protein
VDSGHGVCLVVNWTQLLSGADVGRDWLQSGGGLRDVLSRARQSEFPILEALGTDAVLSSPFSSPFYAPVECIRSCFITPVVYVAL